MTKDTIINLLVVSILFTGSALAEAPDVKTPSPVIYLSDNLGEPDGLGWCIDTQGRGHSESLHAHSCKPRGGDVQFGYDPTNLSIYSAEFDGKCMTQNPAGSDVVFGLGDCDANSAAQRFDFNQDNGNITPTNAKHLCVAVGEGYRGAGPFSSRALLLSPCVETEAVRIHWVFRED